jgi:DNA-directed RNA polymerase sigma subunit (sigma70/sigma32)
VAGPSLLELHARQKEAEARAVEARASFRAALHQARESRTLEDIARELGVTRSRVWQMCKNAKSAAADTGTRARH